MVVFFSGFGPKPRNKMSAKVDKFDSGENHDRHVSAFEKVMLFTMFSVKTKTQSPRFQALSITVDDTYNGKKWHFQIHRAT